MIETLDRVARDVWAYHYRIPEPLYWGVGVSSILVALVAMPNDQTLLVLAFILLLSIQGILRWQLVRKRCRVALVVPLFQEGGNALGRAAEAQTMVVDHLRRHLTDPIRTLVQAIPVVVTSTDEAFAAQLQRRLRATFVLHGRVATRQDGGWSVYPAFLNLQRGLLT